MIHSPIRNKASNGFRSTDNHNKNTNLLQGRQPDKLAIRAATTGGNSSSGGGTDPFPPSVKMRDRVKDVAQMDSARIKRNFLLNKRFFNSSALASASPATPPSPSSHEQQLEEQTSNWNEGKKALQGANADRKNDRLDQGDQEACCCLSKVEEDMNSFVDCSDTSIDLEFDMSFSSLMKSSTQRPVLPAEKTTFRLSKTLRNIESPFPLAYQPSPPHQCQPQSAAQAHVAWEPQLLQTESHSEPAPKPGSSHDSNPHDSKSSSIRRDSGALLMDSSVNALNNDTCGMQSFTIEEDPALQDDKPAASESGVVLPTDTPVGDGSRSTKATSDSEQRPKVQRNRSQNVKPHKSNTLSELFLILEYGSPWESVCTSVESSSSSSPSSSSSSTQSRHLDAHETIDDHLEDIASVAESEASMELSFIKEEEEGEKGVPETSGDEPGALQEITEHSISLQQLHDSSCLWDSQVYKLHHSFAPVGEDDVLQMGLEVEQQRRREVANEREDTFYKRQMSSYSGPFYKSSSFRRRASTSGGKNHKSLSQLGSSRGGVETVEIFPDLQYSSTTCNAVADVQGQYLESMQRKPISTKQQQRECLDNKHAETTKEETPSSSPQDDSVPLWKRSVYQLPFSKSSYLPTYDGHQSDNRIGIEFNPKDLDYQHDQEKHSHSMSDMHYTQLPEQEKQRDAIAAELFYHTMSQSMPTISRRRKSIERGTVTLSKSIINVRRRSIGFDGNGSGNLPGSGHDSNHHSQSNLQTKNSESVSLSPKIVLPSTEEGTVSYGETDSPADKRKNGPGQCPAPGISSVAATTPPISSLARTDHLPVCPRRRSSTLSSGVKRCSSGTEHYRRTSSGGNSLLAMRRQFQTSGGSDSSVSLLSMEDPVFIHPYDSNGLAKPKLIQILADRRRQQQRENSSTYSDGSPQQPADLDQGKFVPPKQILFVRNLDLHPFTNSEHKRLEEKQSLHRRRSLASTALAQREERFNSSQSSQLNLRRRSMFSSSTLET